MAQYCRAHVVRHGKHYFLQKCLHKHMSSCLRKLKNPLILHVRLTVHQKEVEEPLSQGGGLRGPPISTRHTMSMTYSTMKLWELVPQL